MGQQHGYVPLERMGGCRWLGHQRGTADKAFPCQRARLAVSSNMHPAPYGVSLHDGICRKDLQRRFSLTLSCFLLFCNRTVLSMYFALQASAEETIFSYLK